MVVVGGRRQRTRTVCRAVPSGVGQSLHGVPGDGVVMVLAEVVVIAQGASTNLC